MSSRPPPTLQFDNLIVDQDAAKELQCGICLQILNKPRQCKNGHLFCLSCILKSISKNTECPSCRCRLTEENLSRSLFVERHIRNLKVFCKYHFKWNEELKDWDEDEQGCPQVLTLETRVAHEQVWTIWNHCFFLSFEKFRHLRIQLTSNTTVYRNAGLHLCRASTAHFVVSRGA